MKKFLFIGGAVCLLLGAVAAIYISPAFSSRPIVEAEHELFVPTGSDYDALLTLLGEEGDIITDLARFERVASLKGLHKSVRPGRYLLREGMSAAEVVGTLRGGMQTPVRLTFNNIRTLPQLAGRLAEQIEPDSLTLLNHLTSPEVAAKYGFTTEELIGMFLPNTYEVWWTITPEGLTDRMKKEYDNFWNEERKAKLERTGLTQKEVSTLASIICEETQMGDEMPTMAGVYINRLRRGMLLQADPTVKFALGDFTLRRILNRHLEVDSPYNTYKYAGLPPSPICMPSIRGIEAVLNYKESNYLYFCAKEDFSGYHNFARTLSEHNRNARRYAAALNRAGIR
ncbi:MAG: endolytic transglycosylase MltG [Tidjanibacter sp.]|nr:endolytic transglycosylase MltG [Tidjanibacter sp.]MBR6813105.1 endolytic transglycosylase MltG [Tidjanibacter sp.]MBR7103231.1 endolytic transglycosylase MltG [Tidjanibacter sp.]